MLLPSAPFCSILYKEAVMTARQLDWVLGPGAVTAVPTCPGLTQEQA